MELAYVWCQDYGSFGEVSLNLSTEFEFEVKFPKLIIRNNPSYDGNVFREYNKNLRNVSAFVGENGSGKTTVLRMIMHFFTSLCNGNINSVSIGNTFIMVFYHDKKFSCYLPIEFDLSVEVPKGYSYTIVKKENKKQENAMCMVTISNTFSFTEYAIHYPRKIDGMFYNMSNSYLLRKRDVIFNSDNVIDAWHDNIKRQIAVYNDVPLQIKHIRLRLICDMFGTEERIRSCLEKRSQYISTNNLAEMLAIWKKISARRIENIDMFMVKGIFYSLFMWVGNHASEWSIDGVNRMLKVMREYFNDDAIDNIYQDYQGELNRILERFFSCMPGGLEAYSEVITAYINIARSVKTSAMVSYIVGEGVVIRLGKNSTILQNLYEEYLTATCRVNDFLLFEWDMSTGEAAFMDLYAKIYAVKDEMMRVNESNNVNNVNNVNDANKGMLFMFDEIDLYLHPEWQQKCLKKLIDYILDCFSNIDIQIILATHSPIFLSDIPGEHVIYCKNGKFEKNTQIKSFGENIYRLYQNSFFLNKNNSIGVLGDFSNECIKRWMDFLRNALDSDDVKTDEKVDKLHLIRKLSKSIGEPLIRNTIYSMSNELMTKWELHDKDSWLEMKLSRLSDAEKVKLLEMLKSKQGAVWEK